MPDGDSATPTDTVQTLLKCADIWDKDYTTISELIADDISLLKVLTSNNAIDYLVRSTTFATSIVADEDAMKMIHTKYAKILVFVEIFLYNRI